MEALTFFQPNKNLERLHSCLQTRSGAILFPESRMEQLRSFRILNQTPPKYLYILLLAVSWLVQAETWDGTLLHMDLVVELDFKE
jgi:hypothetical protein